MTDETITIDPDTGEILGRETGLLEESTAIEVASTSVSVNLFGASSPEDVVVRAVSIADALKSVLVDRKLIKNIKGKEYPLVEAWTLLGSMLGVFPVVVWTKETQDGGVYGWEARVEARTINGDVVGAAEAQCTRSEKMWADRDSFTLRAMAQTRATSRAMRQPLGFVMSLAGYEATAAEEMPVGGSTGGSRGRRIIKKTRVPPLRLLMMVGDRPIGLLLGEGRRQNGRRGWPRLTNLRPIPPPARTRRIAARGSRRTVRPSPRDSSVVASATRSRTNRGCSRSEASRDRRGIDTRSAHGGDAIGPCVR